MKSLLLAFYLSLFSCIAFAYQNPSASVPSDFVIGLEDVLAINVWREPELSVKDIMVRPDGKVSLPLVGDVQASGLTPNQLRDRIAETLKQFVASPNVTVVVMKIGSQSVSIVGQVAKPGIYYLGGQMSVLELLARAGGLREEAKSKKISIIREEGGKKTRYQFNYKDVASGQNLKQNIDLKNGDVVLVP